MIPYPPQNGKSKSLWDLLEASLYPGNRERCPQCIFRKFGQHKDDIHYTKESTEQFDLKPVSDEHFKIRKIKLEDKEYEIKEIPTLPFRVNEDPLSEENAFEGIYDMIDIMGDDPSVTPAQLCHGHKVYRGVDLGVRPDDWFQRLQKF